MHSKKPPAYVMVLAILNFLFVFIRCVSG
jgi:hypothetical protein